ncbi:inosine/xanthosine triphosphatase [Pyrobaculum calidifontis]|uniref:Probable inosine/xanthosine triphosphatase n=1 Tax=Pyrobaculum calidifontis (strain DSM 21063 / JCM 11548 / VA1) TaxID=410359 RepID=NCPP_PYRCJ|nr:DUF84 family protein [Pyrobaculum calidifontis]A3MVS2.1 RecName: Full=Probable inosine/xanthosine triphosphatase; Short=ITPase/XTPase; AltName: Full=Non-canonical purine NTP phosphatase; AltName: Full=Non-standard purine NTP phosphatase; AltName: Full=Nucleoside-triphosphate phosphatase; Short=NTPase [Pyrobaculum calidifontis JCM 11548]ABO08739.1 protein of unknown function DUF84 [Pyrobaculum calidifontis JCM 11548]
MKVAAATRNPNKLRAIREAYRTFGFPAEVVPVDKPPGAPPQPIGLDAVAKWALERARHALAAAPGADHGVGIEAGVVEVAGYHLDITIAAIVDREGYVTVGTSPAFQIPTALLHDVLQGRELGATAEAHYGRPAVGYREGIIGLLTRGVVKRIDLNYAAVLMALTPRLPHNAPHYRKA